MNYEKNRIYLELCFLLINLLFKFYEEFCSFSYRNPFVYPTTYVLPLKECFSAVKVLSPITHLKFYFFFFSHTKNYDAIEK